MSGARSAFIVHVNTVLGPIVWDLNMHDTVYVGTVLHSNILGVSLALFGESMQRNVNKFAFSGCIFYFPTYAFPGVTLSSCGPLKDITGFYSIFIPFLW